MSLLEAFLDKNRMKNAKPASRFSAGQITIIDLSDPFIDSASACGIFEIITRLFVRAKVDTGKVLVVDEAHKVCPIYPVIDVSLMHAIEQYLSSSEGSSGLTKALLTLIREQRHKAMRVIISTQGTIYAHLDKK